MGAKEERPTGCCEQHMPAGQTVWRGPGGSLEDMPNWLRSEGWEGIGQPKAWETAVFWAKIMH